METIEAIRLINIDKRYKNRNNQVSAVTNFNLIVNRGELFVLIGPNGAGKTTIVKIILKLVLPTNGGVETYGLKIGAVLEGTRNIYWRLTPLENLYYFGALRGVKFPELKNRANYLLEELELQHKRNNLVQQLSRGMQQKVALGVALIHEPEIIILDEPTLGLDVISTEKIKEILFNLKKKGKAIFVTTHQLSLAEELADRIGIIVDGELKAFGTTNSLKEKFTSSITYLLKLQTQQYDIIENLFNENSIINYDKDIVNVKISFNNGKEIYPIINKLSQHEIDIIKIEKMEATLKDIFLKSMDIKN